MKYNFPENLYTDVRIESRKSACFALEDEDVKNNSEVETITAMIRVFDGKMWYTSQTDDIENIQDKIDNLATLAKPNPKILKNPIVKNLGDCKDSVLVFTGKRDLRNLTAEDRENIVRSYYKNCEKKSIKEIKNYGVGFDYDFAEKSFYSSKGAEIIQDYQRCHLVVAYEVNVNDVPYGIFKQIHEFDFDKLWNKENEVFEEFDRGFDFAKNAVDVVPGEYTCVLSPSVTSVFTHESFGHKSEADFMLNDKALQDEWPMGKKVAFEKVSIVDEGDSFNHGYCPYDDEGNKKQKVYLIKDGILTGRLHDAKSAATLKEKPTGNARAQNANYAPIVRMTNTYIENGTEDPEEIIKGVKDGIYVYDWNYGTGQETFTIQPRKCYKIKDGKLVEPLRVNVITGSVFKTLFDIDAVGNDLEFFSGTCGKDGQSVPAGTGGPTIRVKKLTIN